MRLKGYTSLILIMTIFVSWKINILINNKTSIYIKYYDSGWENVKLLFSSVIEILENCKLNVNKRLLFRVFNLHLIVISLCL